MTTKPQSPQPASVSLTRWINVILRGLHLVSVIMLGAGVLGAPLATTPSALAAAVTGLAMLILDVWKKPSHLREVAGLSVLVKLVVVVWMALDANLRPALFWLVVVGSAIFAHAPAKFRHAILIAPRK